MEAAADRYEQNAVVTNPDGSIVVGIDAVRVHLGHLVELGGFMTSQNRYAISIRGPGARRRRLGDQLHRRP